MLEIDCAGERLVLLPEKAVFWPSEKTLIVADLHLGKTAAFRAAGIGVPELTTTADLDAVAVRDVLLSIYRPRLSRPVEAMRLTFSMDLLLLTGS